MSYMYSVLATNNEDVLNKVGYTYYDVNGDGIEELLIGEITKGEWKGIVYDIYTMINRKPKHIPCGSLGEKFVLGNKACA